MAAVILFTAAGIAAPLFIIMVVIVLIPWLLWGFSITTERLHDRDKSAWWLVMFYLVPGVLGQLAKNSMVCRSHRRGTALHTRAGKFRAHDLGICRDRLPARHPGLEHIPDPTLSCSLDGGAERLGSKNEKSPAAIRPPG
jgi:Predicted membrane protein